MPMYADILLRASTKLGDNIASVRLGVDECWYARVCLGKMFRLNRVTSIHCYICQIYYYIRDVVHVFACRQKKREYRDRKLGSQDRSRRPLLVATWLDWLFCFTLHFPTFCSGLPLFSLDTTKKDNLAYKSCRAGWIYASCTTRFHSGNISQWFSKVIIGALIITCSMLKFY